MTVREEKKEEEAEKIKVGE
jgi:hypothetical protein